MWQNPARVKNRFYPQNIALKNAFIIAYAVASVFSRSMESTLVLETQLGKAVIGDAIDVVNSLPPASVKLLIASPPFDGPEQRKEAIADWLMELMRVASKAVSHDGSVVLELGLTWRDDGQGRVPDPFRFVSTLCSERVWYLHQEFYWYNPRFLSPPPESAAEEWVGFRDCVTMLFCFSRQKNLRFNYESVRWAYNSLVVLGGNLLTLDEMPSDVKYLEKCRRAGRPPHEGRFPKSLPSFFIELLTEVGDLIVDPFAGSCASGAAAERLRRRWLCVDVDPEQFATAGLRFEKFID